MLQVLGQEDDLSAMAGIVRNLAVDRLHNRMRLASDSYGVVEIRFFERLESIRIHVTNPLPTGSLPPAWWPAPPQTQCRDYGPVSLRRLFRKSVQRERMFPAKCLTMSAMEFISGSSAALR